MTHPLVIAHRGASAELPENTLVAFRRTLALGVDGIELDARVTRDGVAVVFHDANLQRMTGRRRLVRSATWHEIQALRVAGGGNIPRLADVLRLTRGRAIVQVEIKPRVPVAPVLLAVQSARAREDVIIASFSPAILRAAARLAPKLPRMLIYSGTRRPSALVRQLATLGAVGLSLDHRAIKSAALARYFQARGYSLWCWTVNRPAEMRRLSRLGVNALLSDDPALLRRTLRKG